MDRVQLPIFTSTPRAERSKFSEHENFIQISPIFPTSRNTREVKSMIPVLITDQVNCRSKSFQPLLKTKNSKSTNGSVPTKSITKLQELPKVVPVKERGSVAEAQTKRIPKLLEVLPKVVPVVPVKEIRSSVDEAIESVVKLSCQNERPSLLADSGDQVIENVSKSSLQNEKKSLPDSGAQDNIRTNPRASKILQRPSALPSVPEEGVDEDTAQPSGDCIFKTKISVGGWQIPTETRNTISLKRKSNFAITKRNKKNKVNHVDVDHDDESMFDSPELPNLVQVSSLCEKRKTFVLNKKCDRTNNKGESHESITDGIVPLKIPSQENTSSNKSIKIMPEDVRNKLQETGTKKYDLSAQASSKNEVEDGLEGEGNLRSNNVSGSIKVDINKKNIQSVSQSDNIVNSKTESVVNITKELSKPIPKKKETGSRADLNTEPLRGKPELKRTLRERKPNIKYDDNLYTDMRKEKKSKENAGKRKKESATSLTQEHKDKENLTDLPAENKSQRRKTAKKDKEQNVHSESDELPFCHQDSVSKKDAKNVDENDAENRQSVECTKKEGETTSVVKKRNTRVKSSCESRKKGQENKVKDSTEKTETLSLQKEDQTTFTNIHRETDSHQNNQFHETVGAEGSDLKTRRKPRLKKQATTAESEANQNESHAEEVNAGTYAEGNLQLIIQEINSSTCGKSKKTEPGNSPKTKNKRRTGRKNPSIKHADNDYPSIKPADFDADCNKAKNNKKFVEEFDKKKNKNCSIAKIKKSAAFIHSKDEEVQQNRMTLEDKYEVCPETGGLPCVNKMGKSEEIDSGTCHSVSESALIKQKSDVGSGYRIKDLLGTDEGSQVQQYKPGVTVYKSLHINNVVMMGEVQLLPGAVLSHISTNTFYVVIEGMAQVRIAKHLKTFKAGDDNRRFFIPKNMDAAITNVGDSLLKMEFSKFKG